MISYSDQSQPAFAAFYRRYNDIDIYVEDSSLVGLYERVFSKILDGIARITSVTPLGNRTAVIAEANRLKSDRSRKRFFLVDGDFHWLLAPKKRIRSLYALNCYCFENLAYERTTILRTAFSLAPQKSTTDVENDFSANKLDLVVETFQPLFEIYAVGHLLRATCPTVAYAPDRLLHKRPNYLPDPTMVRHRVRRIYLELRLNYSKFEIKAARDRVRSALTNHPNRSKFISGKYLVASLLRWFQTETEFRGKQNQLISLILANSDLSIDPKLAPAVRRVAR